MNTTPRNCPDIGVWRASLDHEANDASLDTHLSHCPACQRLVADLRTDAAEVRDILSVLGPARLPNPAEVALARERLAPQQARRAVTSTGIPSRPQEPIPMFITRLTTPWRVATGGIAAALMVALLVAFTPEGSSVAAAFLSQFRSQQVAAIEITPQTQADIIRTMNALGNLGTVEMPGSSGPGPVRPQAAARNVESQAKSVTLAEAAQTVGPLLTPDPAKLPAGVSSTPLVRVMPGQQIRFTFDKKKAQAYYQSTGHPEVSLPDKFDGASLVVSIPTAAILEYGGNKASGNAGNTPALVVAEAGELTVETQGKVSLPEMRDFLLGLPGLPPTVVSQLKAINSWTDTLPIPVPVDQVQWKPITINGAQGLQLDDNSGIGSAVIWHANGHLYGVAGTLKAKDLKPFVDSLAFR